MQKAILTLAALPFATAAGCYDDEAWAKVGSPHKDCDWVAGKTDKRCEVKGYDVDGKKTRAAESCVATCGTCTTNPCQDAPLVADFGNVPCVEAAVQSAIDVTKGFVGEMEAGLDPIPDYNAAGMCTVNVHWHIGAEHRSEGQYDEHQAFDHPAIEGSGDHRRLSEGGRVGHMCANAKELWEANDEIVHTEYDWQYCNGMNVGLTYEFHWPHSNLGACHTEWQLQTPFMDGVLCGATMGGLDFDTAVAAIGSGAAAIGVEGQVFTIVNSPTPSASPYFYAGWNMLDGWYTDIATDIAHYQGSTTGDKKNNDDQCGGTGGAVTWHQDRECHLLEAATMDNLCRMMLTSASDDMEGDVEAHGSRETVLASLSDTPIDGFD